MIAIIAMIFSFIVAIRRLPTIALWLMVVVLVLLSPKDQQSWGVYHYYMGAKYAELGYTGLYECSIEGATVRRDLKTYDYRNDSPDCNLSPAQHQSFKADLQLVDFDLRYLVDKGPNMSPTWIAIAQALIPHLSINQLIWTDAIAMALAISMAAYFVGFRNAGYVALFTVSFYGTVTMLFGHIGQWWWLASLIVGVSAIRAGHNKGVIFIALSASLAVFPAVLMLFYWRSRQMVIIFSVSLFCFLAVGILQSRGIQAYLDFASNMITHSSYIRTEMCCNAGLAHQLTYANNPDNDYLDSCYLSRETCRESYDYHFNALVLLALAIPLIFNPLSIMFAVLTLSIFYYQALSMIVIWQSERAMRWLFAINGAIILFQILVWDVSLINKHWILYIYLVGLSVQTLRSKTK